ncbi:hypothetical protein [Flavobacterium aurantiibacter]|uniref:Uncharacterized protein n=1 Tax=Flavobacterium aurantiibacter TaxID=2023067 RepID=A0A256AD20_9FLAO|nr:hypothetical protein [Flavobacterium aurantiibacter]OYQ51054.1 hypothetical protein CHX27_00460 [Flavobacterium aurantiibacter]
MKNAVILKYIAYLSLVISFLVIYIFDKVNVTWSIVFSLFATVLLTVYAYLERKSQTNISKPFYWTLFLIFVSFTTALTFFITALNN